MTSLPQPDSLEQADNCLLLARGDQVSPHWLVYEAERDFLSTPRIFIVVRIFSVYDFDWIDDESLEYEVRELDKDEFGERWRVNLPRLNFECWGSLQQVDTCYGCANATAALMQVLNA